MSAHLAQRWIERLQTSPHVCGDWVCAAPESHEFHRLEEAILERFSTLSDDDLDCSQIYHFRGNSMHTILEVRTRGAEQLKSPENVRAAVLGLMRITLQHACVVLGEWIANTLRNDPSKLQKFTGVDLKDFVSPSDGELIRLLSELLVAAENIGWKSAGRQYWETSALSEPLQRLVGKSKANIETILFAFVRDRNDGVEGHGLPGGYDPDSDIAVIRTLITKASPFLPTIANDGETLLIPPLSRFKQINLHQ